MATRSRMARRKNSLSQTSIIESLESRRLLTADIAIAFNGAVPTNLAAEGSNTVSIKLTNVGTTNQSGPVSVELFASTDRNLTIADKGLTPLTRETISLTPGHSVNIPFVFQTPRTLAAGQYYLIAEVLPSNRVPDSNAANNVAVSATTVTVPQQFVDLKTIVNVSAAPVVNLDKARDDKPVTVWFTVTNQGNVTATGPLTVDVFAATHTTLNAHDAYLFSHTFPRVSIAPGATQTFSFKERLPGMSPSGTFDVIGRINNAHSIVESNYGNNTAVAPQTLTIVNRRVPPGPFIAGALTASVTHVSANSPTTEQFTIALGRAEGQTTVVVDEFDSAGHDLGTVATLHDTGAVADGDAVANDGIYSGMGTVNLSNVGNYTFVAKVSDPLLTRPISSAPTSFVVTPPVGPTISGTLNSDTAVVGVGSPELTHFNVKVNGATANTTVEIDEVDAQGNNLGKLADLFDDGSAADGDQTAGDGIYSGISVVSFLAPGTRYFVAVVSDPTLSQPVQSTKLSIVGMNAPSNAAFQTDATVNTQLTNVGQNVLNNHGTDAQALNAVANAAKTNPNVVPNSVQTNSTTVTWTTVNGTIEGFSTDFADSPGSGSLSAPSPTSVTSNVTSVPVAASATVPVDPAEKVLILSPFASSLSSVDPSSTISTMFTNAGYSVTYLQNQNVTLSSFTNLGQYDAVDLYGHGTLLPGSAGGEVFFTSIQASAATSLANAWALLNHRVVIINGKYCITPSYITAYSGAMNGTIVEANACDGAFDSKMANAFLGNGAGAYFGYTQVVKAVFAAQEAVSTWTTMLKPTNNTVNDVPGLFTAHDVNNPPAYFVAYGDLNATLPQGNLLKDNQIVITYNWPQNEKDLDSDTTFLGQSVGWNLANNSSYLTWSGDDTGFGGQEKVTANLYQAWVDGQWAHNTTITVGTDWYTPAGGSGPAFVTVALQNIHTGALKYLTTSKVVSPGQEDEGAHTTVATIDITLGGSATNPKVTATLA